MILASRLRRRMERQSRKKDLWINEKGLVVYPNINTLWPSVLPAPPPSFRSYSFKMNFFFLALKLTHQEPRALFKKIKTRR